jgi:hypothetical protein
MEAVPLRPRSATEIVDAAFRLSRANYPVLVTVTGVIVAPALLLKLILPGETSGLGEVFARLLFAVSDGAVIAIASAAYLGRSVDASTGLRAVRGRLAALIFSSLARNILIAIGLILLIIPGLFLFVATFAVPMAIVLEDMSFGAAFTRARQLVEEHIAHSLGTLVLLVLIVGAMFFGLVFAVEMGGEFLDFEARTMDLMEDAGLILLYPLYNVGTMLLYYDLRIRREGFDIEQMSQDLHGAASPLAPAAAPPPPVE